MAPLQDSNQYCSCHDKKYRDRNQDCWIHIRLHIPMDSNQGQSNVVAHAQNEVRSVAHHFRNDVDGGDKTVLDSECACDNVD